MNVQKPVSILREELVDKLAKEINESGLPALIIEPILEKFLNETRIAMKYQYEKEKELYEESLKKAQLEQMQEGQNKQQLQNIDDSALRKVYV